jgi:hypothetical protein
MGANKSIELSVQRNYRRLLEQCISICDENPHIEVTYSKEYLTIILKEKAPDSPFYISIGRHT